MIKVLVKLLLFFCTLSFSFSTTHPIPELNQNVFSKQDVIFFDYLNQKYYGIIVTAPITNLDQKDLIKLAPQMEIKAKGKLSNYLNKKYKKESVYNFSSFIKSQSCNFEGGFCNIYVIRNDDIKIIDDIFLEPDSIKKKIILNTIDTPNGVNIIEVNGSYFLVSHFKENVRNSSAIERISLIKKTDIQAERNLSSFINSSVIDIEEQLISQNICSQYCIEISENYFEKIQESSKGTILNSTKINKLDDSFYSSIIYIEIPTP